MKKIILASASPRRRELLTVAGVEFDVLVSDVDETIPEGTAPKDAAMMTAEKKALAVAEKCSGGVVIGADTIVVIDDMILGKPKNEADAVAMLRTLSGREHQVITGVCITDGEKTKCFAQVSKVRFYDLTDEEITSYVASEEPMDKAGSYGIQGRGCVLVEGIEGDYFNIVGLPVAETVRALKFFE
ncbi:MAG: septum formation inhibitor Maf [Clostridia bacterium]|nr:septum formation inhibitor Maf [Clostridia bacterium]